MSYIVECAEKMLQSVTIQRLNHSKRSDDNCVEDDRNYDYGNTFIAMTGYAQ